MSYNLSASSKSYVYKSSRWLFEIVSISLYDRQGGYASTVLMRNAEIQCFQDDDSGNYTLEEDDWTIIHMDHSGTSTHDVMRKVNELVADLVKRFDVQDVPSNSSLVKRFRQNFPHNMTGRDFVSDITREDAHEDAFWEKLSQLFVGKEEKFKETVNGIRSVFPTLKNKAATPTQPKIDVGQYESWGAYS